MAISPITPFIDAYIHSDLFGKGIFLSLFALSIMTWTVILYSWILLRHAEREGARLREAFACSADAPLGLDDQSMGYSLHPMRELYQIARNTAIESIEKNQRIASSEKSTIGLTLSDIDLLQAQLNTAAMNEAHLLQRYMYILSTIVSLAPFLGLLGTVWGILTTFSDLQQGSSGGSHQVVLHGLSLALATTVVGLLDAIPALVGYNILKQRLQEFSLQMETFSQDMLSTLQLQYRHLEPIED